MSPCIFISAWRAKWFWKVAIWYQWVYKSQFSSGGVDIHNFTVVFGQVLDHPNDYFLIVSYAPNSGAYILHNRWYNLNIKAVCIERIVV